MIAGVPVEVTVRDTSGPRQETTLVTDGGGQLTTLRLDVPVGSYELELGYDGDDHRRPAEVKGTLSVVRWPMSLTVHPGTWVAGTRSAVDLQMHRVTHEGVHDYGVPAEATFEVVLAQNGVESYRESWHGTPVVNDWWQPEFTLNVPFGYYDLTVAFLGSDVDAATSTTLPGAWISANGMTIVNAGSTGSVHGESVEVAAQVSFAQQPVSLAGYPLRLAIVAGTEELAAADARLEPATATASATVVPLQPTVDAGFWGPSPEPGGTARLEVRYRAYGATWSPGPHRVVVTADDGAQVTGLTDAYGDASIAVPVGEDRAPGTGFRSPGVTCHGTVRGGGSRGRVRRRVAPGTGRRR